MKKITFLILLGIQTLLAQNYTEYLTGNAVDVATNHQSGVCMMGGNFDQADAMKWFLTQANGGDVVVLRASGDDGYNNYMYSQLGVPVNSVRTFVINNANGAVDPYVLEKVAQAEAIWFAGGDQYDYVKFFKDNAMEDALNIFINTKKGVIGGISAGLAIMGSAYFTAELGGLDSDAALLNPYHARLLIDYDDFLKVPYLGNVITDSHFAQRNRQGRLSVFMARSANDNQKRSFGIGCDENTAITINASGKATVYGPGAAYFAQANCSTNYAPEIIQKFKPLTWNGGGEAIKTYKVIGKSDGSNYFDLSDWQTGNGGTWENWSVNSGILSINAGTNPMCESLTVSHFDKFEVNIHPNPTSDKIFIKSQRPVTSIKLYSILGKEMAPPILQNNAIDMSILSSGMYVLKIYADSVEQTFKILKN